MLTLLVQMLVLMLISILIYLQFILVLNYPYDRCYLSLGPKSLCWLGFRLLCNVSTNT